MSEVISRTIFERKILVFAKSKLCLRTVRKFNSRRRSAEIVCANHERDPSDISNRALCRSIHRWWICDISKVHAEPSAASEESQEGHWSPGDFRDSQSATVLRIFRTGDQRLPYSGYAASQQNSWSSTPSAPYTSCKTRLSSTVDLWQSTFHYDSTESVR